jgi:hypothetical protein
MGLLRMETVTTTPKEPLSQSQAERLGIKKLNRYAMVLECRTCGASWTNIPGPDGDLPRDFWCCPRRCNWW